MRDTDFVDADDHVVSTTVNGAANVLHGKCSPRGGYYTCGSNVAVRPDANNDVTMLTRATPTVDSHHHEGSFVYARHTLAFTDTQLAASDAASGGVDALHTFTGLETADACAMSVDVWKTGFTSSAAFVAFTTANDELVHGVCETDQATAGVGDGWYRCADGAPVSVAADGTIAVTSTATAAVAAAGPTKEGAYVYARYTLRCERLGFAGSGLDSQLARHRFVNVAYHWDPIEVTTDVYKTDYGGDDHYVVATLSLIHISEPTRPY